MNRGHVSLPSALPLPRVPLPTGSPARQVAVTGDMTPEML